MSERDRLAELLARATRERRGEEWESAGGEETGEEVQEATEVTEVTEPPEVTGGEWLPRASGGAARHREGRGGPTVLTWPESLRSVQLAVRPLAVVGVLVVVLVAAGIFGVRWWRAEQASQPVPVASRGAQQLDSENGEDQPVHADSTTQAAGEEAAPEEVSPSGGEASTPTGDLDASGSATGGIAARTPPVERLLVHVAGQVREPGVVSVEAGARVQDAVEAAGGLAESADTSRVNLARPVTDGERIWVPKPGEDVPELVEAPATPGASGGNGGSAGAGGGGAEGGTASQININTAEQARLEDLPGVGPVTAAAIIQWRSEHGPFSSPDELLEVSGIGEATLEKLLPHVTL